LQICCLHPTSSFPVEKADRMWDDVDVVHWNVGIWDILRMQDGEPLAEINVYRDYVDRICMILKMLFLNAALVFATSTAVQKHLFDYYTRKKITIGCLWNKRILSGSDGKIHNLGT